MRGFWASLAPATPREGSLETLIVLLWTGRVVLLQPTADKLDGLLAGNMVP